MASFSILESLNKIRKRRGKSNKIEDFKENTQNIEPNKEIDVIL